MSKLTKSKFESTLKNCVELLEDGGTPELSDIMLIDRALGGWTLYRMNNSELQIALQGVLYGYELGAGYSIAALMWDQEDDEE
jgi:hypothetical protein